MNKDIVKRLVEKDYGNAENNSAYKDYGNRKRMMKFNRFFADYKVFTIFYVAVAAIVLIAITVILNRLQNFDIDSIAFGNVPSPEENTIGIFRTIADNRVIYMVFIILLSAGYIKFAYNVRVSFGNINVGQKHGMALWHSWTTSKMFLRCFLLSASKWVALIKTPEINQSSTLK